MMTKYILLVSGLIIGIYTNAQTISTDAPSMTPSSEVLVPSTFQLESRAQYTTGSSGKVLDIPINLIRIGLSKRFELRTVNGYSWTHSQYPGVITKSGSIRPIEIGTKYSVLQGEERKFKMAILAHYTLPMPSSFSKMHSVYAGLTFSNTLSERSSLAYSLNFNYSMLTSDDEAIIGQMSTLCYSHQLNDRLSVFGEIYSTISGWQDDVDFNDMNINFDAGFYALVRDNIQLDYTFGYGARYPMMFHSIGVDIMFAPNKKK